MNVPTESELREALRPLRPDPEAFRRGFDAKLRERGQSAAGSEREHAVEWKSAAAVLPLGLLQPTLFGAPVVVAGQKVTLKGLATALALPALSIAMLAMAFVGTMRAAGRVRSGDDSQRAQADRAIAAWWRQHCLHALLTLAVLLFLALTMPAEAVVLILILSMILITVELTQLSRAGAASRARVGELTSGFLGALLVLAVAFGSFAEGLRTQRVPEYWIPLALVFGHFACFTIGRWKRAWTPRRKLSTAALFGAASLLVVGFATVKLRPLDPSQMAGYASHFDSELPETLAWIELGQIGGWLRDHSDVEFDPTGPRRVIEEAWRTQGAQLLENGFALFSLAGAARLDLLPEDMWQAVRAQPRTRSLLDADGPINSPGAFELSIRALVREPLAESERDHLAQRLRAGWPAPDAEPALERMAAICELLELLDRPLPAEPYRADAHRALSLHWHGGSDSRRFAAAFVADTAMLEIRSIPPPMMLDATHDAVLLMQRFGVPDSISTARVRAFLRRAATPSMIEVLSPSSIQVLSTQAWRYRAAATLREALEIGDIRSDEVGLAQRILSERILIGTLLLVALCLFATLRMSEPAGDGLSRRAAS